MLHCVTGVTFPPWSHWSRNHRLQVHSGQRYYVCARKVRDHSCRLFREMPSGSSPLSYVERESCPSHGRTHDEIDEHGSKCNDSAVNTFSVGLRVVRLTEWPSKDNESDGGEGIVGTVVKVGSNFSSDAETAIRWDIGTRAVYTAGCHGQYDLCVLDNSSVGKKATLFLAVD